MYLTLCVHVRSKVEQDLQLQSKCAELAKLEAQLKLNAEGTDSLKLENKKLLAELSEQQRLLQTQVQENTGRATGAQKQVEESLSQVRLLYSLTVFSIRCQIV